MKTTNDNGARDLEAKLADLFPAMRAAVKSLFVTAPTTPARCTFRHVPAKGE